MRLFSIFLIIFLAKVNAADDLLEQKITELVGRKTSVYSDSGVFFHKSPVKISKLEKIRSSFGAKRGYERIVLDFSSPKLPGVYGYIGTSKNKIYLDLLNTSPAEGLASAVAGKYLSSVDILALDKTNTSLEINLKEGLTFDVFYLESPARLVIDVKK